MEKFQLSNNFSIFHNHHISGGKASYTYPSVHKLYCFLCVSIGGISHKAKTFRPHSSWILDKPGCPESKRAEKLDTKKQWRYQKELLWVKQLPKEVIFIGKQSAPESIASSVEEQDIQLRKYLLQHGQTARTSFENPHRLCNVIILRTEKRTPHGRCFVANNIITNKVTKIWNLDIKNEKSNRQRFQCQTQNIRNLNILLTNIVELNSRWKHNPLSGQIAFLKIVQLHIAKGFLFVACSIDKTTNSSLAFVGTCSIWNQWIELYQTHCWLSWIHSFKQAQEILV